MMAAVRFAVLSLNPACKPCNPLPFDTRIFV